MCCLTTIFQIPFYKHQQMAFASKSRVAVTAVERKLRGSCSLLLPKWHGIIQLYKHFLNFGLDSHTFSENDNFTLSLACNFYNVAEADAAIAAAITAALRPTRGQLKRCRHCSGRIQDPSRRRNFSTKGFKVPFKVPFKASLQRDLKLPLHFGLEVLQALQAPLQALKPP